MTRSPRAALGLLLALIGTGCMAPAPPRQPVTITDAKPVTPKVVSPLLDDLTSPGAREPAPLGALDESSTPLSQLDTPPRSGTWTFRPQAADPTLKPFSLRLTFRSDGSIGVAGAETAPPRPDACYLRTSTDDGGPHLVAYVETDRLYVMKVQSATVMAGEAWDGIRPPRIVPVAAEWTAAP